MFLVPIFTFKASWSCSLREAHGEAVRVQGGAEPERTWSVLSGSAPP